MTKSIMTGLFLLVSCSLFAGGYGVAVQGQKQIGMAHTGTGLYLDAAGIFFNPGSLTQQQTDWEFTLGVSPLLSTGYYQNRETYASSETENPLGTPAEFYAAYRINEKWVAGLGFYTPFGSGVEWSAGWEGRALITKIQLKSYFIQPTIAYQLNDWLSLGGGLVVAFGEVNLQKDIPAVSSSLKLSGKTEMALGYNLGAYIQPSEKISIGLNYRSKINGKVNGGEATFNQAASLDGRFIPNDTFSAELPLISSFNIGAAYRLDSKWTLASDVNFNNWSEYEVLDIRFDKNSGANAAQARNYKNTITARIGAQHQTTEKIQLRAGYYYDPSPVRKNFFSPETPSMHNHGFTFGGTLQATEKLSVDLSFLYIKGQERYVGYEADNFWGDFKSKAIVPGVGISYKF